MSILTNLEQFLARAKNNLWFRLFTWFNRVALAIGFITAGSVKIVGERFASGLSVTHPMGHYLEALHQTGYYYTFIGILQIVAGILLVIPRTTLLGAMLYFPIIVNIFILSMAVRFEGSLLSSPLMVLSNLYLLCWDYDRLKYIFMKPVSEYNRIPVTKLERKFPWKFLGIVIACVAAVVVGTSLFQVMPRNSSRDCNTQFIHSKKKIAGQRFCDCIHVQGKPLDQCMDEYDKAPND